MKPGFTGFPVEGVKFLGALKKHNKREWFQPRKEIFDEKVKAPMLELTTAVMMALADFAPAYVSDPNKAIFRIYRDTRFSNDKTPYKTHIAAAFPRRGGCRTSGFYFSVSAGEIEVGGGVYMPSPEDLRAIRGYLADHHEEFRRVSTTREIKRLYGEMTGDSLTRTPKGYPPDHPAADLLRMKQFLLFRTLETSIATTPKLYRDLVRHFEAVTPFLEFLARPVK